MEQMTVEVLKILNGEKLWLTVQQGELVYQVLRPLLSEGRSVVRLDMTGHEMFVTPFLNGAIGPLFDGTLSFDDLQTRLIPVGLMDEDEVERWDRVVANAKDYYKNRQVVDAVNAQEA